MRAITDIDIAGRQVGSGEPVYVIAEMSANHQHDLRKAKAIVEAAASAGADAIKLQTYTPDTMTLDSGADPFRIGQGTLWEGQRLYDLYQEAHTPWEWHEELAETARAVGIDWLSTPFDASAVDFLEKLDPPVYKIASFELVDLPLIARVAGTGKPLIISTGMGSLVEIDDAVRTARANGAGGLALLRCNSAYPAPFAELDLAAIPVMEQNWNAPVGFSDHTLGHTAATVAVTLGACIVEKHITLSRDEESPDSTFSVEPVEFADLVQAIRDAAAARGEVRFGPSSAEQPSLRFRRSLWIVRDVAAGEVFTSDNVRALRPSDGLPPSELDHVLGRRATRTIERGTALTRELLRD